MYAVERDALNEMYAAERDALNVIMNIDERASNAPPIFTRGCSLLQQHKQLATPAASNSNSCGLPRSLLPRRMSHLAVYVCVCGFVCEQRPAALSLSLSLSLWLAIRGCMEVWVRARADAGARARVILCTWELWVGCCEGVGGCG